MTRALIDKRWGSPTWITLLGAAVLCLFALVSTAYFLSHPFASDKELERKLGDSATLLMLVLMAGGHVQVLMDWTLCIATCFVCTTAILGATIMVRAPDQPANRQVVGLLLAFASLLALRFFFNVLPSYQSVYKQAPFVFELTDVMLLVYLALGLARFLVIFPRAVDTDSVHQTYIRRPFLMRWSRRAPADNNLLRHWQAHLVSGQLLWMALLGPLTFYCLVKLIGQFVPFDEWGGVAVAVLAGLVCMYFLWGLPYAFASTSHLYRFGTLDERKRLGWLRAALLGLGTMALLSLPLPFIAHAVAVPPPSSPLPVGTPFALNLEAKVLFSFFIFWALIPVSTIVAVGVAVLNNGALDPRLAFTRVTLWSIMGLTVTLAFIALERYAAVKVVHWFALPPDTGAVAAGAVIAGTFVPIRNFVAAQVERIARQWVPLDVVAEGVRVACAVAISDLSGYAALSALDERSAVLQSAALGRQAERIAQSHAGALVKSMGDAVMMTFTEPESALKAVQELHAAYREVAFTLGIKPLGLRSAIHFGEIVQLNDGNIFGLTVNICLRMVNCTQAGDIVISDELFQTVEAQQRFKSMGQRKFKNVPKPVGFHRLIQVAPTPPA
jgi:class 3 adenylate cyclase